MKEKLIVAITGISLILLITGKLAYADDPKNNDQYVSRKQYEQLKDEMAKLKEQVQFLLKERSKPSSVQQANTAKDITQLQDEVKILKAQNEALDDGTTGFLLTGYGFAGYTDSETSNSSFNVGFNPIFL